MYRYYVINPLKIRVSKAKSKTDRVRTSKLDFTLICSTCVKNILLECEPELTGTL